MLFALGLGDSVAGVTHECDYPPGAEQLPHLTRSVIGEGLPAAEIDARGARAHRPRRGALRARRGELAGLGVDFIVTQAVCAVCAVSFEDVQAVAERLPARPAVISLDPSTIGEVLADVTRLADAAGAPDAGARLVAESAARIEAGGARGGRRVAPAHRRPGVARPGVRGRPLGAADDRAGGRPRRARLAGEHSRTVEWSEVEAAAPEVVVSMPCGLYAEQAAAETVRHRERLGGLDARVVAVDAAAYFSRPAHGWWTAWSCSATSCTRSSCRRPIRGARSRSTWRSAPSELPAAARAAALGPHPPKPRPRSRRPRPRQPGPRIRPRAGPPAPAPGPRART